MKPSLAILAGLAIGLTICGFIVSSTLYAIVNQTTCIKDHTKITCHIE